MKWVTHQASVACAAVWFKVDPAMGTGLLAGAILPDMLERMVSGRDTAIFNKIHRGFLHWFGLYVLGFAIAYYLDLDAYQKNMALGLMLGALAHLALDALNPSGIPLFPFAKKPRIGYNLLSTSTFKEWLFLGFILAITTLGAYDTDKSYFEGYFKQLRNFNIFRF